MATSPSPQSSAPHRDTPRAARGQRSEQTAKRRLTSLLGNAAFLLLGLSLLTLGGALVVAGQRFPVNSAANGGSLTGQGAPQAQNTSQSPVGEWIPLHSTAPADILAAARKSSMFQQNLSGGGDHVSDLSRLGTPVLVRAIQPAGAVAGEFPDFYVVPILNGSGATTDAAELALNAPHTAIQVTAIVTYSQPRAHGDIARVTPSAALAAVSAQQHAALRSGAAPQLVYFPADADAQATGQVVWTGGGEFPADPIWLVPGADGRDHLVGVDGKAYYRSQLPLIKLTN